MADDRITLRTLQEAKTAGRKIVGVVAWDYQVARIVDRVGVDLVSVGDTVGVNLWGHANPFEVTMDQMLTVTQAVRRGVARALVSADFPFGPLQEGAPSAVRAAIRFVKEAGVDAVKLEGAGPTLSRVRALVGAGIAVMGHVGLTPQSATLLGGFRAQGRTAEAARRVLDDALALEAEGCFAIVLEAVPAAVAARVTEALHVPTIGIGSGPGCDGQVLIFHDLVGLYEGRSPRFAKRYADVGAEIRRAFEAFAADVRSRRYPEEAHTYAIPDEELARFRESLAARQG